MNSIVIVSWFLSMGGKKRSDSLGQCFITPEGNSPSCQWTDLELMLFGHSLDEPIPGALGQEPRDLGSRRAV